MYLVFAGEAFYPSGGWNDLVGSHTSLDDAKCSIEVHGVAYGNRFIINSRYYDWYQIVNARTLKVVEEKW